jgi:histidinol-phosphate aminotransferase
MRYWSKLAAGITPYVPGEQPKIDNLIKLNTNENPYPPSPHVLEAIRAELNASLRLYPEPESTRLCRALALRHGLEADQVFAGNGSDEVLALAFQAYFDHDAPVRFANISYSFYEVFATLYGIPADIVRLNADFSLPLEKFYASSGGVIICNPNAPTGLAVSRDAIRDILEHNKDCAVIVDEAYVEFGAESAVPLIREYDNLLVVKTFSKSHSLAGLRVGYAMGSAALLEALYRIKNSFNSYPLDRLAQAGAAAAIEDEDYCRKMIAKLIDTRKSTQQRLAEHGFTFPQSSSNFVFASHERVAADVIMRELRARGIIVRRWARPIIDNHLRITIGTDEQMDRFFYALDGILK